MHLLSTRPGGFVEDESIVTRLDQTPADIVILSSADTTLALLSSAVAALAGASADFPSVRLANLLYLRQPASLDLYVDEVLRHARVVIVDHLGSESAWPYGIEQIGSLARRKGQRLAMFSGDLQEDPHLLARSTLPAAACRQLWQYLRSGGAANAREFLKATVYHGLDRGDAPLPPRTLPQAAVHVPRRCSLPGAMPRSMPMTWPASTTCSAPGRRARPPWPWCSTAPTCWRAIRRPSTSWPCRCSSAA